MDAYSSPEEVKETLVQHYPKFIEAGGFDYLKCSGSNRALNVIPLPSEGYGIASLREAARSAKIYVRPIQSNLSLIRLKEQCKKCERTVPQTQLRPHVALCGQSASDSIRQSPPHDCSSDNEDLPTVVIEEPTEEAAHRP
ncbi:uncharacterized protein [Apostichopus japonicus]|uniref:uncharacterized protein isoform X2 n=1 Tax=Stichopus japonicus TaxID=307972 RepID=UPI003AB1EC90